MDRAAPAAQASVLPVFIGQIVPPASRPASPGYAGAPADRVPSPGLGCLALGRAKSGFYEYQRRNYCQRQRRGQEADGSEA